MTIEERKARFDIAYPQEVSQLLHRLGVSLVLSTYKAGKLIFIGAKQPDRLTQTPVSFKKPMGIAAGKNLLGVASIDRVDVFTNNPTLAASYPPKPSHFEALYFPRTTYHSGGLDLHDLHWTPKGLMAVNTQFSCLCKFDYRYNFTPIWKPHFISDLVPEDRCHLNGLAMVDGAPHYVTALGKSDEREGWRSGIEYNGVLMSIDSNTIIADHLCMPHSPRVYRDELYVLESGQGRLLKVDAASGATSVVAEIQGFVRGLAFMGNIACIGLSKIRRESKTAKVLPVADIATRAGIVFIDLETGQNLGMIEYLTDIDEIYDIQIIENSRSTALMTPNNRSPHYGLALPDKSVWGVREIPKPTQKPRPDESKP